jgi:hypothetical protein
VRVNVVDPPVGGARVEPMSVVSQQDRSFDSLADGEVEGATGSGYQRDGGGLVALSDDPQGAVAAFEAEVSMLAPQASLTCSPLRPSSTARAACIGEARSAVWRKPSSSPRSMPRCEEGWTRGRRTCWAGLEEILPSRWAKR